MEGKILFDRERTNDLTRQAIADLTAPLRSTSLHGPACDKPAFICEDTDSDATRSLPTESPPGSQYVFTSMPQDYDQPLTPIPESLPVSTPSQLPPPENSGAFVDLVPVTPVAIAGDLVNQTPIRGFPDPNPAENLPPPEKVFPSLVEKENPFVNLAEDTGLLNRDLPNFLRRCFPRLDRNGIFPRRFHINCRSANEANMMLKNVLKCIWYKNGMIEVSNIRTGAHAAIYDYGVVLHIEQNPRLSEVVFSLLYMWNCEFSEYSFYMDRGEILIECRMDFGLVLA
jgi:hypothetical protein